MMFWLEINFILEILYCQNGSNGKTQKCLEKIWRQTLEISEQLSKCKLRLSFQNHKSWHKTFLWTKHKVLIFYICTFAKQKGCLHYLWSHLAACSMYLCFLQCFDPNVWCMKNSPTYWGFQAYNLLVLSDLS